MTSESSAIRPLCSGSRGTTAIRCSSGASAECLGERVRGVRRPEVLVLEVDQPSRAAQGLAVGPADAPLTLGREGEGWALRRVRAQDLDRRGAGGRWVGTGGRERVGSARLARQVSQDDPERVAVVEGGWVGPSFPEGVRQVADRRPADLELQVVPGRAVPVRRVQVDSLRVAVVPAVVTPAVTQVDAADEGDVVLGPGAPEEDELLMVAATAPHSFVEHELAAGFVDLVDELGVLLLAEVRDTRVRPPEETADVHATPREIREDVGELGARSVETFVGIAFPVGQVHPVVPFEPAQLVVEPAEVLGPVDEHPHVVAFGPRRAVAPAAVDVGRWIPSFGGGQEPAVE